MARRYRLLAGLLLLATVALIAPAPASALSLPDPTDLLPSLPSVGDILESILKKLVDLVVPREVSKAWSKIVAWLVALPDPTSQAFRNLNGVRESLQAAAVGLLSLSFILAAFRYWVAGFSGDAGVASALRRCVLAVVAMIAYPQAISTAIAGVNTLTASLVANHTVTNGLDKVLGAAFLIAAATSGLSLGLAVAAVLASLAFFAGLLVLKILLTTLLCVLLFAGPLVIALYPLPATEWLFRAWAAGLMAAVAIPAAWALIFATGAVVGADALVFSHSKFIVSVAKPFVAVACLYLAWRAPFFIVSRAQMAGLAPGLPVPGMRGGDRATANTGRVRETSGRVSTRNADRFRALRSIGTRSVSSGLRSLSTKATSTAASTAARTKQAAAPAVAAADVRLGAGAAGQAADKTAAAAGRGGRAAAAVTDAARRGHAWWAKDLPAQGAAQRAAKPGNSDSRADRRSPSTPTTQPKTTAAGTRPPAPTPSSPRSDAGTGTPPTPAPAARRTDAPPSKGPPPQPGGASTPAGKRPAGWKPPGRPPANKAPAPPQRPKAPPHQRPRERRPSPPTRPRGR